MAPAKPAQVGVETPTTRHSRVSAIAPAQQHTRRPWAEWFAAVSSLLRYNHEAYMPLETPCRPDADRIAAGTHALSASRGSDSAARQSPSQGGRQLVVMAGQAFNNTGKRRFSAIVRPTRPCESCIGGRRRPASGRRTGSRSAEAQPKVKAGDNVRGVWRALRRDLTARTRAIWRATPKTMHVRTCRELGSKGLRLRRCSLQSQDRVKWRVHCTNGQCEGEAGRLTRATASQGHSVTLRCSLSCDLSVLGGSATHAGLVR